MVCHGKTIWHQVIAIKNRRNIQLSFFCLDFSNVCNAFFQRCICCKITFQKIIGFACFPVGFGDSVGLSFGSMDQVYLLHHAADSCFARDFDTIKLADFFSVLECLIHTYSAVIRIFFVLIMNFQYGVGKRLILPWFALTLKVIVKRLSADLQRVAIKTDFSDVSAVICPDCNIHQPLFFPDF